MRFRKPVDYSGAGLALIDPEASTERLPHLRVELSERDRKAGVAGWLDDPKSDIRWPAWNTLGELKPGAWHRLVLRLEGRKVSASIDGKPLPAAELDAVASLPRGLVPALFVIEADAEFADVAVESGGTAAVYEPPRDSPRAPRRPGRLSGRVLDADSGEPLDWAEISADSLQAVTGADGSFALEGVPGGELTLVAKRAGYKGKRVAVDATDGLEIEIRLRQKAQAAAAKPASNAAGGVSLEAYGRDETDGSAVGWNSGYPAPSFDDDPERLGKPNAAWQGSYFWRDDELCLQASGLNAPYPPSHTLSVGYTVSLEGRVFADGSARKTVVLYRFSGLPSRTDIVKCLGTKPAD